MKNIRAFTLVELIVVITILAVLGTIAFVSFQGYAVSSRDSARLSNLKVTQKALQYYFIENSIYPEPSKGTAITFSGAEVWTQGTIGESVVQKIKRLTSVPTDPLTGSEMTYSRLNTKGEIELATTFERGLTLDQTSNVYAGETQGIAYIVGDYNGLVAKVSTGSSVYVLAVPSIINGDISVDDYSSLMGSNKLSVQGKNVIPASYTGTTFDSDNTYDLGITNLVVYSGSTLPTTQTELNTFITTLQDTYSGSTIQDTSEIGVLVGITDADELIQYGNSIVNNNLGGNIVAVQSGGAAAGSYKDFGLCDIDDIHIPNGCSYGTSGCYAIAGCNVGTTVSGVGAASYGDYIQFGKSDNSWINGFPAVQYDWKTPAGVDGGSANDWGITESNKSTITFNLSNGSDQLKMQGVCPTGYHVPSNKEWNDLITTGGWGSNGTQISTDLLLPFSGLRYWIDGNQYYQNTNGYYWSASPHGGSGYALGLETNAIHPNDGYNRATGLSVRCFKD